MSIRDMLKKAQGKLGIINNRIESLRSEISSSQALSPDQKAGYLKLINERAALFSKLSDQINRANSGYTNEQNSKELIKQLLNISDHVTKIKNSFDQIQAKRAPSSNPEKIPSSTAPKRYPPPGIEANASKTKTAAPTQKTPINPKLEAAKSELTVSYVETCSKFKRMQASWNTLLRSIDIKNMPTDQKIQTIGTLNSMKKQYQELESKVNNIGRILGSMSTSATASQIVQMKKTVTEISEGSRIMESRIANEYGKAMPVAPTGFKRNPPADPDSDLTNSNRFGRR